MELLHVDIRSENSPSIALYADGSFCQEVGVGAWAFRIPAMNLEDAGSSEGHTATRFEFLGVLHGLESLAATDTSGCPVHVFSDCESTVAAIIRINKGGDFQNIKKYEDRVDLLPRLRAVMAARVVQVTLYTGGSLDHQNCHRRARQRLREEIGHDARRQHHLALTRQRSRLTQLIEERGALIHRLGKLDEEISIAQVHAEALLLLMRTAGSPNNQSGPSTE